MITSCIFNKKHAKAGTVRDGVIMNLKSAKRVLIIGGLLSLVLFALFILLHRPVILYICLAAALITVVVWGLYGRCPHCGQFLHIANYEHCPHCGEKIES